MKLLPIIAAAAALVGVSAPASAAIVVAAMPGYQGAGAGFEGILVDGPLSPGYSEAGITFDNIVGSVKVLSGTSGEGAFPYGDTSTRYLSVLGGPSSVTLSFGGAAMTKIGFYWGSIDTYNTVEFWRNGNLVDTVVGGDVSPALNANGNQGSDLSNRYVTLYSAGAFDAVKISSSSNSFELDNISAGVPEPSTWAMMMLGFAGLGFAGYRRANKARAVA